MQTEKEKPQFLNQFKELIFI